MLNELQRQMAQEWDLYALSDNLREEGQDGAADCVKWLMGNGKRPKKNNKGFYQWEYWLSATNEWDLPMSEFVPPTWDMGTGSHGGRYAHETLSQSLCHLFGRFYANTRTD